MPAAKRATVDDLPPELTSFVGRRHELSEIKELLTRARLVTLTGMGGSGKTRLALRTATDVRRAFRDGVWFVDLTELVEPQRQAVDVQNAETLAYLIAGRLGVRGHEREPLELLIDRLVDGTALLVLDNCEHLIPACAVVVDALLRGCPRLQVLATSREPLGIAGETPYPVPSLPLPPEGHEVGGTDLPSYASVALFLDRGQAAAPGFRLTAGNRSAVAGICRRLDGLPLAIELAAARLPALSADQILDRLDHRFALLNRGSRTAPERHQTLLGCVTWSFELCAKPERVLWTRLAVFAGGFDLEAIEGVCADDILPATDVLDVLTGLVDKSVLVRDHTEGPARYRMLTTIRDFGLLELGKCGDEAEARERHARWYLCLAEQAEREWFGPKQVDWCRRLRLEHANLRAAFDHFLAHPAYAQQAVRLAASLWFYWLVFGQVLEGRDWLRRATEAATAPGPDRAKALWAHGHLASVQGDLEAATRLLDEALDLACRLGDELTRARAIKRLGAVAMHRGDLPEAERLLVDALARLHHLGGNDAGVAHAEVALALTRYLAGDLAGAVELGERIRTFCQVRDEQYVLGYALNILARAEFGLGNLPAAAGHAVEAIAVRRALPDALTLIFSLDLLCWITAASGDHERAATLAGAAESLWKTYGSAVHRWQFLGEPRQEWATRLRRALGDASYTAAARRGAEFTVEQIISYALGEKPAPTADPVNHAAAAALTRREMQIADLVGEGRSNREIAAHLVISQRTVESHVEHILQKLGFTSRVQVATWIHRRGRDDARSTSGGTPNR